MATKKIKLHGVITPDSDFYDNAVSFANIEAQFNDVGPEDDVIIHISSPGGSVFEGYRIYNYIASLAAKKKTAYIDSICASMATLVSMACDEVISSPKSMYMTHMAMSGENGNAKDMAATTDLLKKIDSIAAESYAKKTGKSLEWVYENLLNGTDTWLTPQDALDYGLIDRIIEPQTFGIDINNIYNSVTDLKDKKIEQFTKLTPKMGKTLDIPLVESQDSVVAELNAQAKEKDARIADLTAQVAAATEFVNSANEKIVAAEAAAAEKFAAAEKKVADAEKKVFEANLKVATQEARHKVEQAVASLVLEGKPLPKDKQAALAKSFSTLHAVSISGEGEFTIETVQSRVDASDVFDNIANAVQVFAIKNHYLPSVQRGTGVSNAAYNGFEEKKESRSQKYARLAQEASANGRVMQDDVYQYIYSKDPSAMSDEVVKLLKEQGKLR